MIRIGVVKQTDGGNATVLTTRQGPCGGCSKQAACALPIGHVENQPELVVVDNAAGARVGDTVEIDLAGHTELKVSLLLWVLPVVAVIAGAALGSALHQPMSLDQDLATLLGAAISLVGAYGLLRVIDRRATDDPRLVPQATRIVAAEACPSTGDGVVPAEGLAGDR